MLKKTVAEGGFFDSKADTFTVRNMHVICTNCKANLGLHRLSEHLAKKANLLTRSAAAAATALSLGVSYKPPSPKFTILTKLLNMNLDFGEIAQHCPERGKLLASLTFKCSPPPLLPS